MRQIWVKLSRLSRLLPLLLCLLLVVASCQGMGGQPRTEPAGPSQPASPIEAPTADLPPLVLVDPAAADIAAALLPPGLVELTIMPAADWGSGTSTTDRLDAGRSVWYFGPIDVYAAMPVWTMMDGHGVDLTVWPDAPDGRREADYVQLGPVSLPEPQRFFLTSGGVPGQGDDALDDWLQSPAGRRALTVAAGATRLSIVGDLQLARGLETRMQQFGNEFPLELVKERLEAADLTVAGLESPIGVTGEPLPGKGIWFRARPEAASLIRSAGIDAVTLANNHILDYDTENLLETLDLLRQSGIHWAGAGRNLTEARRPAILTSGGVRLALLSYSEFADLFFSFEYPRSFRATDTVPGVAPMELDLILADIAAALEQAAIVAVALHWGIEYQNVPEPWQVELARALIDGGADLIIGQHPHAVQGFEQYKHGLIFYSFGNFVMDQYDPETRESLIADIWLTPDGVVGADIVPVHIDDFRPRIAGGEQREWLWQRYQIYSSQIP